MENRVKKNNSYCSVPQCRSKGAGVSFHRFPDEKSTLVVMRMGRKEIISRRSEWIRVLKMGKKVSNRMSVCSLHFQKSDYLYPDLPRLRKRLKKTAVPSLNLPVLGGPSVEVLKKKEKNATVKQLRYDNVSTKRFPLENAELMKKWVSKMARGTWKPSKFSKLCSEHFEAKCFVDDNGKKLLKPNAVPSVFSDPSYVQRRGRKKKRPKRGRPRKAVSVNKKQPDPSDSTTEEAVQVNDSPPEDRRFVPDQNSSPEANYAGVNGSQDGSEYDSDRTTSDVDSSEPVSLLQGKLRTAKLEIMRLQVSTAKWESLNEALKPENRDPFLIERLNVIQKDAAQGHANSIMLLNSIILYGKDPEEIA